MPLCEYYAQSSWDIVGKMWTNCINYQHGIFHLVHVIVSEQDDFFDIITEHRRLILYRYDVMMLMVLLFTETELSWANVVFLELND